MAALKHNYLKAFAVLFFLMLFVLGIGSTVGMGSCIIRVIRDQFVKLSPGYLALALSVVGFALSTVYMCPGGQFILNLVDFYGVSFTALILAIGELLAVSWVYGRFFFTNLKFSILNLSYQLLQVLNAFVRILNLWWV